MSHTEFLENLYEKLEELRDELSYKATYIDELEELEETFSTLVNDIEAELQRVE